MKIIDYCGKEEHRLYHAIGEACPCDVLYARIGLVGALSWAYGRVGFVLGSTNNIEKFITDNYESGGDIEFVPIDHPDDFDFLAQRIMDGECDKMLCTNNGYKAYIKDGKHYAKRCIKHYDVINVLSRGVEPDGWHRCAECKVWLKDDIGYATEHKEECIALKKEAEKQEK